jgi:DNA repair protein RadC
MTKRPAKTRTLKESAPTGYGGHRQRLREKFFKTGLSGLHDYEVVELLLTYAIPRMDVKPLAKDLVNRFKGLRGILDASMDELTEVPGMGEHSAGLIKLAKDMGTAYLEERVVGADIISSPGDVIDFLTIKLAGERVEKFLALYSSTKNEVLAIETINEGTINQTAVYPRKVIEHAIRHNARSIIFVHNHPSGDSTPSKSDIKLTKELEDAARTVDILVHDHIIIGRNSHHSLRDSGWPGKGRARGV